MTRTLHDETCISVDYLAKARLQSTGQAYVSGRVDAGDSRLDHIDGMDFGDFYAAHHTRPLDLPELYERFITEQSTKDES